MPQPQPHGPWQILDRREVYQDPWIVVLRDEVIRPDGHPGSHCVVRLKAGVCVLAVDDAGTAYLTEEFHYGVGRVTLEAVSGGIDGAEQPEETARRELQEELGITAAEWINLGTCDPLTSVVTSPTGMFLARGLTFGPTTLEGTETLRCRPLQLDDALQHVLDGRITHAPSCVLILRAARLLGV